MADHYLERRFEYGELLAALEADRHEVEAVDLEALEAEIDEAVHDLFGLEEEEQEVIEEYLEVF